MPSASTSLAARVALGTALAAGLAALLAALACLAISDRLVLAAEDSRLRGSAALALREIIGAPSRAEAVTEERDELAPEGLRLALFEGPRLVDGDTTLPPLAAGTCAFRATDAYRACAVGDAALRIVISMPRTPVDRSSLYLASGLAVLLSAVAAAALGRRAARWALAPLTRLGHALGDLNDADPRAIAGDDRTTEVAALRRALADLVARLGASLGAARRFSADAAHEMKTPLTVLRAELELLAEEPLAPDVRRIVEKLRLRVIALGNLVTRLLALANANDRASLAQDAVAMEDVVREVVGRLRDDARTRVTVLAADTGMVLGDETLLGALVENAVDNALKFSSSAVDVQVQTDAGVVVVEVIDRGPGVDAAERARAFEPFFRTPASRASALPGHGVGLTLVAQIASAHAGEAALVDPPAGGPGVCLRVRLPGWRRL